MHNNLADQRSDTRSARGLGPWMSLAMVVGAMIGSAIYLLPAVLAPYGPNITFAWLLSISGTMCIALGMARLAANIPGGPTAYVTSAFGDVPAFLTMWSYMVSVWSGITAVALAVAGALSYVFPAIASGVGLFIVAAGSIILLAIFNLISVRTAGRLQVTATMIKLLPLLAVLVLVAAKVASGHPVEHLTPTPIAPQGILAAAALTLFALTGFEVGPITAPVTENAERNVPRAQIIGVAVTGFIYLTATLAVLWLLPSASAATSRAPFAEAIAPWLGPVAGTIVALIAAISALGANNALMLGVAELTRSVAQRGDLPLIFARTRANGVPYVGIVTAAVLSIALLIFNSAPAFVSVYAFVALVSAIATLLLYAMCSAAVLKLRLTGGLLGTIIAVIAALYSLAMFFGAGWEATKWGLLFALSGIPIRWLSRRYNALRSSPESAVS
ncbi:MAG: amino acid permease [Pseudomonadota bacterium]